MYRRVAAYRSTFCLEPLFVFPPSASIEKLRGKVRESQRHETPATLPADFALCSAPAHELPEKPRSTRRAGEAFSSRANATVASVYNTVMILICESYYGRRSRRRLSGHAAL